MKALFIITFSLVAIAVSAQTYAIKADYLIDGTSDTEYANPTVLVYNGKIIDVNFNNHLPDSAKLIELKGYTILPGLIDVHTHVFINDVFSLNSDIYGKSASYRSLRAVSLLETALNNGFTTIREISTLGAGFADVDLANAVESGYIDGPRIFPSTKGIAVIGNFLPNYSAQNWELDLPSGAQYVSGKDECLKATREQIARGATWIKVWVDWQDATFTPEELSTIVQEADKYGIKVAAHAKTPEGIELGINAGVKSIEHGEGFTEDLIQKAIENDIFLCPTITVYEYLKLNSLNKQYEVLRNAYKKGMKIALSTDVGCFPWDFNQSKELEFYVKNAGFKPMDAIKSGTSISAELLGRDNDLGQIKKGYVADIIAV